MGFSYFPHTDGDIREMLGRIGAGSLDGLYSDVPQEFIFKGEFDLPEAMSEMEVRRRFAEMAERNRKLTVFCGCGAYDHYSPAVIPYLTSRAEFQTAYTPYQAEVSQGTLRYIFEYQSMITMLSGMDCSNASMYDGATAAAEAMMMSIACTRKKSRVLLSRTLLPQVIEVVRTYAGYHGVDIGYVAADGGVTSLADLQGQLGQDDEAGVLESEYADLSLIISPASLSPLTLNHYAYAEQISNITGSTGGSSSQEVPTNFYSYSPNQADLESYARYPDGHQQVSQYRKSSQ